MSTAAPLLAVAAGSLTTLSPCVLPILPLVLAGSAGGGRWVPLAMAGGLVSAFALLGLLLGTLGGSLGLDGDALRQGGGWLLLLFALALLLPALGSRFSRALGPLADAANLWAERAGGHGLPGAFALGALLGVVWSPCSGPLLGAVLVLVASEGGAARGTLLLGLFGAGAALPLLAVAYASRSAFLRWRDRLLVHGAALRTGFAVLLLLLALAVLQGWDKQLEAALVAIMPDAWVDLTVRI